jgi:hypothetical protein
MYVIFSFLKLFKITLRRKQRKNGYLNYYDKRNKINLDFFLI